jgi:PAS domain S-box-containing protein
LGYFSGYIGQIFTPELHETWMRLIVICLIITLSYYTQSIISRRKRDYDLIRWQHNLALQLGTVVELDETLRLCVEAAIKGTGMDAGGVYLVDENSGDLNLMFSKGLSPDFIKTASHYDADSSNTRLIMAGQPIYVKYSKLKIPLDEIKRREGLSVIAILPVHYKGQVIGSLNIASHYLDEIPVATRKMLETMAGQISSYIARARTEGARKESEKRYLTLFESAGDAIFLMDGEQFIDCNLKTLEMFGCTRDQIIGTPPYQYSPKQQADGRDSQEKAVEKINLALNNKPQHFEWLHCCHDGTPFPAEVSLNKIELSGKCFLQAIVRDITERKQAEDEIRKFKTISDKANYGTVIASLKGELIYVNESFAKMHSYTVDEILGKPLSIFHNKKQMESVNYLIECLFKEGNFVSEEVWHVKKNGVEFPTLMNATVITDSNNKPHFLSATAVDITEIKQLQEFAERAKRLETAGRIAGQVAHDFNNLLGPLVAYPELILEDLEENHPVIKYVKSMETAARQMADINQQLLTLGRRGHYNLEPLNLNEVVGQVLNQIQLKPETLIIETDLSEDLMNINGGISQIFRVVANLTSNAVDAMQGIGRLTIKTENWYTDYMSGKYGQVPKGEYVKLTLTDTGCGIQEENLLKVFEPFFSTKKAGKKRGSGLGLSVVHAVIKDHDGFIDLESAVGQGTTVYLYFPITRDTIAVDETESIVGGLETVLVVDDDPVQREVTLKLLQKLGYKADTVECGEMAIEYIKKQPCDLLLLDMIIPDGMDGAETYKKALEINPEQKAIIISGYSESERVAEARRLGVGAFLKKPLTLEIIGKAVRKELDRKQQPVTKTLEVSI